MRDPYDVLGVSSSATQEEIKAAYRRLAKKLHPDLNPGNEKAEDEFQEVGNAYALLGDPEKRKAYDEGAIDAAGQEKPRRSGFYRTYTRGGSTKYEDFFDQAEAGPDIFSDLFGFGHSHGPRTQAYERKPMRRRGADVHYTVEVSFLEAARGGKRRLSLTEGRTLDVNIPAGTEDGQVLRLKEQGMPGTNGAPPGDAFIEILIKPHAFFKRDGLDLLLELPITLQEAVLGRTVKVPTLDGDVSVRIPPGANTGQKLRLRERGIAKGKDGEKGNLYVTLKVVLPDEPDASLSEFLESWTPPKSYNPRKKAGLE